MKVSDSQPLMRFSDFAASRTITVLIPARNEETTVGIIVDKLVARYFIGAKHLFEIVVIDDHSSDNTAFIAARSGATVVSRIGPDEPTGKAETITAGIRKFPSDIYVLFDADVSNFDPSWLELLGGGLEDDNHMLSKGTYNRPVRRLSGNNDTFCRVAV